MEIDITDHLTFSKWRKTIVFKNIGKWFVFSDFCRDDQADLYFITHFLGQIKTNKIRVVILSVQVTEQG